MTKNEIEMLYSYLYNNSVQYENDVQQLQTNLRYRRIDILDCLELICTIERRNMFTQISKDIRNLLQLYDKKNKI